MRQKAVVWSILSAVGGAILLFVGQVAIEEYKSGQVAETKAAETRDQQQRQQFERLDTLFDEYLALGQTVDRAGEYINTGGGGSKEDLAPVVRHLRKVISYGVAGRLDLSSIAQLYGGRLVFWQRELTRLGSGGSPASGDFSESELQNFLQLGASLRALIMPTEMHPATAAVSSSREDAGSVLRVEPVREEADGALQTTGSQMSEAEMEALRRELVQQARAKGIEIPESTLDQLVGSQIIPTGAGPAGDIPPPGIKMSTEKAPTSALDAVVGRQSADNRSEASAKDPKPSAPDDQ